MREIIFDTETTGLSHKDGDRIIEIGAVEMVNRFLTGRTFHMFVNPEGRPVHPDALEIHGISDAFLKDKPAFKNVLEEFDAFFSDGNLVAHNAQFDVGFFNAELARVGRAPLERERIIDTLQIAKRKFPGQRNSLDALCNRFDIDNSRREKHGALLDSELLAEVYLELTGGRQATLALDQRQENAATDRSDQNTAFQTSQVKRRPKPLPSPLSGEDIERHKKFVESLGSNTIWSKLRAQKTAKVS